MRRWVDLGRPGPLSKLGMVLALVVAVGLWLWRPALALYQLEAGGRAIARAETFRAAHPTADNQSLDQALRHFQRAVALTPVDGYAYRRLGQAWLLAGDNNAAQQALSQAAELRPHDPLIHIELGYAWDGLGQAEKAAAEYELGKYGPAAGAAIVNYLKLADWRIASSGGDVALKILQGKVLALDPNSLPALYRMATIYDGMGKEGAELAAPLRAQLKQFPAGGVAIPSTPGLDGYLAQTMVALTEDGTWTRDTLLNVVGYQVWQFAKGPPGQGTEQVLQTLVRHWPDDAHLRFYLAELYHRQADLDRAEANYRRVLEMDPEHAEAMLRLGMVAEARGKALTAAAKSADECQAEPEMADRVAVSTALKVPVSQVELSANLLPTGLDLSKDDTFPAGWRYNVYLGTDGKSGLYAQGGDDLAPGGKALRIDSLWRKQAKPNTGPYSEYTSNKFTSGPGKYLVAVRYSLDRVGQGTGLVFWGEYDVPNGLTLLHAGLAPTQRDGSVARFVVQGPARPTQTGILLRNRSDGSLIVTSACVRQIKILPLG